MTQNIQSIREFRNDSRTLFGNATVPEHYDPMIVKSHAVLLNHSFTKAPCITHKIRCAKKPHKSTSHTKKRQLPLLRRRGPFNKHARSHAICIAPDQTRPCQRNQNSEQHAQNETGPNIRWQASQSTAIEINITQTALQETRVRIASHRFVYRSTQSQSIHAAAFTGNDVFDGKLSQLGFNLSDRHITRIA